MPAGSWSWRLPRKPGPWLNGGLWRCSWVGPLASLSSAPCSKTCCFLDSSTSLPWEPVELQSSVSKHDMRVRPYCFVATWMESSTRACTHKVRGPWSSDASSIPTIHPQWVQLFFPAHKKQEKAQSSFPSLFLPCLMPLSGTKAGCEVS